MGKSKYVQGQESHAMQFSERRPVPHDCSRNELQEKCPAAGSWLSCRSTSTSVDSRGFDFRIMVVLPKHFHHCGFTKSRCVQGQESHAMHFSERRPVPHDCSRNELQEKCPAAGSWLSCRSTSTSVDSRKFDVRIMVDLPKQFHHCGFTKLNFVHGQETYALLFSERRPNA